MEPADYNDMHKILYELKNVSGQTINGRFMSP